MIQAYPDWPSVVPGSTLVLHVSADATTFRVEVYRQGLTLEKKFDYGWQPTQHPGFQARMFADQDWNWDSYSFVIPSDWPSGVYIAMLYERDANGNEVPPDKTASVSDGIFGKALFVVRSAAPGVTSPIVYKIPLATYHAYNFEGGGSLYGGQVTGAVTMHRPGGGTGGKVTPFPPAFDQDPDPYDGASSRQTFEHWDAKFIRWLEGSGFGVDYCVDVDIDAEPNLLSPYALLLCVGHDEYYSADTRKRFEDFLHAGGNIAWFSGNTCWWRIHYNGDRTAFTCNRSMDPNDTTSDQWWIAAQFDQSVMPENILTGVSYRNGAGWYNDPNKREAVGFLVQGKDHWVYEGTGLTELQVFGDGNDEALVGYECDGAELSGFDCDSGKGTAVPTGNDKTSKTFQILGIGCLKQRWDDFFGDHTATMGVYSETGTVFNAATADWARVLARPNASVVTITSNVINRLGGSPRGLATLLNLGRVIAADGFYSPDDKYRHAIVATADGSVTEIFFNPQTGTGHTALSQFSGVVDVGSFYTDDDQYRHVLVATHDGQVTELFYSPQTGLGRAPLASFNNIVAVAGFYSSDDRYRHAIVATADGSVYEFFYHPDFGNGKALLGTFDGLVDLCAFYSADDQYRHAIVAARDGTLTEFFYHPTLGHGTAPLAVVNGVIRVAAYYVADDKRFNRRVLASAADGRLHEVKFNPTSGVLRSVLTPRGPFVDVGGFYSGDDTFRHAIVATVSGDIQELFYHS
jgi:hypothetical protein